MQRDGEEARRLYGGSRHSVPIDVVFWRMLDVAFEAGHGGAFVIIPSGAEDASAYNIRFKYPARELRHGRDLGIPGFHAMDRGHSSPIGGTIV